MTAVDATKTYLKLASQFVKEISDPSISIDDIARIISVMLSDGESLTYVYVLAIDSYDTYSIVGSHGFSADTKRAITRIPLTSKLPASKAMNTNNAVIVATKEEMYKRFPDIKKLEVKISNENLVENYMAVPLCKKIAPIGALVAMSENLKFTEEHAEFLSLLGTIMAPKLTNALKANIIDEVKVTTEVKELTPRQEQMQKMMADGLTNSEIATKLGYSESTVRRESVLLYSKLGVNNRNDAGNLFLELQEIKDKNNVDNFFPSI